MKHPVLCAALIAGLATGAIADTVRLKNGRKITAESVRVEGDRLILETAAGTITMSREDVESIEKTPVASKPAAAPAPAKPAAAGAAGPGTAGSRVEPSTAPPGEKLVIESPPLRNEPLEDWIAQGRAALKERRYEKAESCFQAALAADPRSTRAGLGVAASKLGAGDSSGAAARARLVVSNDPESAQGWLLLGAAEYARGDLAAARRAFEKSRSLKAGVAGADKAPADPGESTDELDDWISRLEAEEKASSGYGSLWSGHFRLQFDPQSAPLRAREALTYLDSIYEEMARAFSHHPSRGLTVVLYPRASFYELTGFGNEVLGLYDGKIRIPTGGSDQLHGGDRQTLRHELAHAFIDSKSAGHCPRWLHEGLAQRVEPRSAGGLASSLAAMKADEAARDGTFTYGSALSFVEFLVARYGEDRMSILLDRLATEPRVDEAMRWAFGPSYTDLVAEWGRSLRSRNSR